MTTAPQMQEAAQALPAVGSLLDRRVMRPVECRTVAALYVEPKGCYVGVPGVDPWDEARDARQYAGPYPVVAHPPCQRWGRFWHGSTRKPHQYNLGDDGGCFAAALAAVRKWGGVLEHPAHSKAWDAFGIRKPTPGEGWQPDTAMHVWVCHVEQGHYGHSSRKPTWLIACGVPWYELPELNWTKGEQRLPQWMVDRYGYEKARRIGVVAMVGGKNKTAIRNATPEPFRDLLLSIARQAHNVGIEPPKVGSNDGLGPLPAPHMRKSIATAQNTRSVRHGTEQGGYERWPDMYTADQMREYALAAIAAEREACAKVCESLAESTPFCDEEDFLRCAAAIRAR